MAIFVSSPGMQTIMIATFQTIFLVYLVITRPFLSAYNNLLSVVSQLFPLMITIYATTFKDSANDPQRAYNNGWGCILMLTIYSLLFMVMSLVAIVNTILEMNEETSRYRY
jgi:amino acid permease